MADINDLAFEMERRGVVFHRDTSMPDDSQLGYIGDPNACVAGNSDGEFLLYNSPSGTTYLDKTTSPYDSWTKIQDIPGGLWVEDGSGGSGGEYVEAEIFVLDAADISNRYVSLIYQPLTSDEINFSVKNAPSQFYGDDFRQDATFLKRITWETLELESILVIGDKITISYTRN